MCATEKEKGRLFWRVWRGEHWCGMAAKTDDRLLLLCWVQTQSRADDTAGLWQSTFYGSVCLLECTLLWARFHSTFSLYLWQYFTSSHQYRGPLLTWQHDAYFRGLPVHEDDESIPVRGTLAKALVMVHSSSNASKRRADVTGDKNALCALLSTISFCQPQQISTSGQGLIFNSNSDVH